MSENTPTPTWKRMAPVAAALILIGAGVWWFTRPAEEGVRNRGLGDYHVPDASQSYYGRHTLFSRPATVRADDVYARIPEYQRIKRRGFQPGTPDYALLMRKASARFVRAVQVVARQHGHDYVGEQGSIRVETPSARPPVDRTAETLAALD